LHPHGRAGGQNAITAPTQRAKEMQMHASRLPRAEDEPDLQDAGPGMLLSRSFWLGGAMSAGIWTLLLLAAVQA
jgi:hypothetical protein